MDTVSVKTDSQSICARGVGVGCIPYLTVPYLTYTFYEDGRGRTISFPDATRHTSRLQPRLLRLAHGGPTTYLFFIQFQYPHSDILTLKKKAPVRLSSQPQASTREYMYHHNLYESCRIRPCHFHISHISQFLCTLATGSVTLYPKLYLYISFLIFPPICPHLQTKDKIRYEDNDTKKKKACCLRHLDEEEVLGCK